MKPPAQAPLTFRVIICSRIPPTCKGWGFLLWVEETINSTVGEACSILTTPQDAGQIHICKIFLLVCSHPMVTPSPSFDAFF